MFAAVLLCCAMCGDGQASERVAPAEVKAYESARLIAGQDAGAHVRLALWCEAHGLTAKRLEHLARAVALDPRNAMARGLLGLVNHKGRWMKPAEVEKQTESDPAYQDMIREYTDRRARTADKADAQMKLAAWCTEKGLTEQARAHYHAAVRLDPSRELAWRHLGYKKQGNRWIKPEEAAAEKAESERQKRADQHWKSRLEKLHEGLQSSHAARREKAEQGLTEVTDPRAVPMVCRVFATGGERSQLAAVSVLSHIDGHPASNALAKLALFSPSDAVRRQAVTALTARDPRDVVGRLVNLLRRPYKYTVRPGSGPGSTGELYVDGERFDLRRVYQFPTVDLRLLPVAMPGSQGPTAIEAERRAIGTTSPLAMALIDGSPAGIQARQMREMEMQADMMMSAAMAQTIRNNQAIQRTLDNDIQTIEAINDQINQVNRRALAILNALTGQDLGPEPQSWQKWWTDQLGYVYESSAPAKPTYTDSVSAPDIQLAIEVPVPVLRHPACFAAGTRVHTVEGLRPIESIQVGDRVLSQDTSNGELAFRPVVAVHRNGPSATLRIAIGGETIVATGIHRFWKAGTGWTMARELKAGDRLRMIGDVVEIQSIKPDATQVVYNLDVAENRDFFVGTTGLLVHDFSFVQPVLSPFDRQPEWAATTPAGRR
jgi:tetratricopeptide (TPR) repeat protein